MLTCFSLQLKLWKDTEKLTIACWIQIIKFSGKKRIIAFLINSFFEIFEEISNFYPEFFDSEKVFKDLLPCLKEKISYFLKEYKEKQIISCFGNIFNFLKKIFGKNRYNKKYQKDLQLFIDEYKKYFFIGCDENKKNLIEQNIKKMMFCFMKE